MIRSRECLPFGVVLVDTVNRFSLAGLGQTQAILEAGRNQLLPDSDDDVYDRVRIDPDGA
jgi:hypothetical protein